MALFICLIFERRNRSGCDTVSTASYRHVFFCYLFFFLSIILSNDICTYSNINSYFPYYEIVERIIFQYFQSLFLYPRYKIYARKRKYIDSFEAFCILERKEPILLVKDTRRACKQRKMVTDAFTVRFHVQVRRVRDVYLCTYIKSRIYLSIYVCLQVIKSQRRRA